MPSNKSISLKALLLVFLSALLLLSAPSSPALAASSSTPEGAKAVPGDDFVQAKAAVLMDPADGRIIYSKNADERRPMASTTKIMTGVVALEKLPLDQVVTASKRADAAGESEIWLVPGEKLTVEELLNALLVKSANDAAVALAEAASGSLEAFIDDMNAKARELGLNDSHFMNPHGLDVEGHYTTARDLAELGRYAMKNETFRKLVGTQRTTISWPGRDYDRVLENHNHLLEEVSWVDGIKTGYTSDAGYCLVGSGTKGDLGLIAVTLGEQTAAQRNADTVKLLEYGFSKYKETVFVEEREQITALPIPYTIEEELPLVTAGRLEASIFEDDAVEKVVSVPEELELPVEKGATVGKVQIQVGGELHCEVELLAAEAVGPPTLGVKARYFWDRFMLWLGSSV